MIFNMSKNEVSAYQKFQKRHDKNCNAAISVTFTNTGIGTVVEVTCCKCKKSKNVTDYSCW